MTNDTIDASNYDSLRDALQEGKEQNAVVDLGSGETYTLQSL